MANRQASYQKPARPECSGRPTTYINMGCGLRACSGKTLLKSGAYPVYSLSRVLPELHMRCQGLACSTG
jgi:hypothetical protein